MGERDLRILHLQGAGVRAGAERALLARLRHLDEAGVRPRVAFLEDGPFRAEVERSGVPTDLLDRGFRARELSRLPGATRAVARAAEAHGAHVIEGCGEKMSLLAGWAARLAGCGAVFNLQDAPRRSPGSSLLQLALRSGRRGATVVPSRWMAEAFWRAWRLRARVIPNAVVFEDLPAEPADLSALTGWPRDAVVFGVFARLVAWKGAETVLRAAARIAGDATDVRVLVVGGTLYGLEPAHGPRLRELAAELGLGDRVHFTGHREDALELMAACDAVCHCPLLPEPFGVAVAEAMALGKPVVASNAGGPAEMVEHGRTGVLVDPADDRALAREMAILAGSPSQRAELGAAAREVARDRLSSRAILAPLLGVYEQAAARRRA